MYIESVRLEDIGCFEDETFEFGIPSKTGHWISLLGDNGAGKTTVLRAIAMGMCGETSASALLRELYGDFVRYGQNKGTITVRFKKSRSRKKFEVTTTVIRDKSGHTEVKQTCSPASFAPWNEVFVTAFGANRSAYTFQDITEYSAVDSVYSLFNYGGSMQHPELIFRRIPKKLRDKLMRDIERLLLLPPKSVVLTEHGLAFDGKDEVVIGGWGDGHRVSYAMLSDIFGWVLQFDREMFDKGIKGVVIIDEFENHLHPSLQLKMIPLLAKRFKGIQFITTTHSPLCAIATTELADQDTDMFLINSQDSPMVSRIEVPPRGMRADQVLTSHLFGLETSGDNRTKAQVERYATLAQMKKRSPKQQKELENIAKTLEAILGTGESELEREIEAGVLKYLSSIRVSDRFDANVINLELRRQLQELLGKGDAE